MDLDETPPHQRGGEIAVVGVRGARGGGVMDVDAVEGAAEVEEYDASDLVHLNGVEGRGRGSLPWVNSAEGQAWWRGRVPYPRRDGSRWDDEPQTSVLKA